MGAAIFKRPDHAIFAAIQCDGAPPEPSFHDAPRRHCRGIIDRIPAVWIQPGGTRPLTASACRGKRRESASRCGREHRARCILGCRGASFWCGSGCCRNGSRPMQRTVGRPRRWAGERSHIPPLVPAGRIRQIPRPPRNTKRRNSPGFETKCYPKKSGCPRGFGAPASRLLELITAAVGVRARAIAG